MPNFSSLARLEVPEKFLWGVGWGGLHSHFRVKPNRCVVLCLGWGFDNRDRQTNKYTCRLVLCLAEIFVPRTSANKSTFVFISCICFCQQ